MAPPRRTFFIVLVTITGILYFLYTIYTSTLDGPTYRFGPWSKVLKNLSYSSSPLIQKKEEQYSIINGSRSNQIGGAASGILKTMSNTTIGYVSKSNSSNASSSSSSSNNNNSSIGSILNNSDSDNSVKTDKEVSLVTNKTSQRIAEGVALAVPLAMDVGKSGAASSTKEKVSDKPKEQSKDKSESFIQKIAPKSDNSTLDYIVQGVITRTVYDSGFALPNLELCPDFGRRLQVVVVVTSAPKHVEARSAIRHTWGHYQLRSDVAIAFIVGRSADVKESTIREENDLYGDIILANFVDSYNNLTLKTVSILEWVDNYCGQAKFVLKTDDDMFINIPKLLQFIGNHLKDKRKIFGKLAKKWKPIRKKTSKYYVSVKQYRNSLFPDFTTGPAYLMTSDVIHDLYVTALEKTYLKLEDVYTTGIVAQEERIQRVHVNEFFNRRITLSPCNVQKGISIHMIKPFEQYDLWKKLLDGRSKC